MLASISSGLLVEIYGMRVTFLVNGVLFAMAALPLLPSICSRQMTKTAQTLV